MSIYLNFKFADYFLNILANLSDFQINAKFDFSEILYGT